MSSEHGDELSGSVNKTEFLDQVTINCTKKKNSLTVNKKGGEELPFYPP